MPTGSENVREIQASDHDAVADLVRALRYNEEIETEMELEWGGRVIGHYALSHLVTPKNWLCQAPVAVHPDWQRQGHGILMMSELCEWARTTGRTDARYIAVLGQVAFYERAGFSQARAARLTSPYPIRQTLLAGPGADVPIAALKYPQAFGRL